MTPLDRFRDSMAINYERWRNGIGYDLEALDAMDSVARRAAESLLLARGARDWRDVEAMAHLDSELCRATLREALASDEAEIRLAVTRYAPDLVDADARTASLVAALANVAPFAGLSQAIDEAAGFHPPPVVDALWRGLAERPGEVAVHYAALLTYLYGQADSEFDLEQRPFFLSFNTDDPAGRAAAIAALRERLLGPSPCPTEGIQP